MMACARRTSVKYLDLRVRKGDVGDGRYEHSGVVGEAPWRLREMTWSARAVTAQARLVPLRPWPIFSPRTPLFWVRRADPVGLATESDAR